MPPVGKKIRKYKTSFAHPNGESLLQIEHACYICEVYIKMGCKRRRNSFLLVYLALLSLHKCCANDVGASINQQLGIPHQLK